MRKLSFYLVFILILSSQVINAQDIFKQHGFDKKPLTLSNGHYNEFFNNDVVVQIGSILLNTQTNQIIAFIDEDTTKALYLAELPSRWLSPDPLAAKYPQVSPYVYCLNNPIRFIDPDGRIVRDPQGSIVYVTSGKTVNSYDRTGVINKFEVGYVFANDGTRIEVRKNLSNDKGFDSNCHGTTFTDGQYWVNPKEADLVIKHDGYKSVDKSDAKKNDKVIYRDKEDGTASHSATVSTVDANGNVIVTGKDGSDTKTTQQDANKAAPEGTKQEYYEKTKNDEIWSAKKIEDTKELYKSK